MSDRKVLIFIVDAGTNYSRELRRLKENISHLRMMIEEAEMHSSSVQAKVFTILIHFQPASLLAKNPCYPALFLKGWDHFYLDTIADGGLTRSGATASVVNVQQWLYSSLVHSRFSFQCDEMEENIEDILRDTIPSVASRLTLRAMENDYKNCLDVSSNTTALKNILLSREARQASPDSLQSNKTQSCTYLGGVGVVLARCFTKYWNSREMNRYLQKFTSLTFLRKSTLNLTASVETTFRSLFVDFLVYRLSRMEVTFELYMLLDSNIAPCLVKCLLSFLEHLPLPRLEQLSQLSDLPLIQRASPPKHHPKFPFLSELLKKINSIIEESDDEVKLEIYKELSPGVKIDHTVSQITPNQRIDKYFSIVKEKISNIIREHKV